MLLFFYLSFYSSYFSQETFRTFIELFDLSESVIMLQTVIKLKSSSFIMSSCHEEQWLRCAEAFRSEGVFQRVYPDERIDTKTIGPRAKNFCVFGFVSRRFI